MERMVPARFIALLVAALLPACSFTLDYASLTAQLDAGEDLDAGADVVIDAGVADGGAVTPINLFALRRVWPSYSGPCVTLRRKSDNRTADFGFTANGDLDVEAVRQFAGGASLWVVRWYDQGPLGNHAVPVFSDNTGGGDAGLLDQPQLILPGEVGSQHGHPVIRFENSRMDAPSPIDGRSAQTILTCFKAVSVASGQRLLSWHFVDFENFPNSSGAWELSGRDAGASSLPLGVDDGWHTYFGRWRGTAVNGQQTFRDGVLLGQQTTTAPALELAFRSNVNVGWFRWHPSVRFRGDVAEALVFGGAVSDAELTRHQSQMRRYWDTPLAP